ncbi:ATP-dependent Clp protease proteolytic subunit [Kangiella sp. TOML190]|uniref:ATP-dependent Clp protease proteolytic subunit n=1 Tax=Kangiella sp. TOML190 TaxID=2931351 RepID=UPI00203F69B2|nr:ATP-dependent Clp protease proteolytic subunit [Kangiella sp. TOML190]
MAIKAKEPPVLFNETQALIRDIESHINRKLICYWTSHRGAICDNDVIAMYEILKNLGRQERVGLFIKSDGGDVEAALRVVNLLREYNDNVVAYIPLESASAATMIALGADELRMGPLAHLTAIDSSLRHDMSPVDPTDNRKVKVSQDELARLVALWNKSSREHHDNPYTDIFKYIHPLVIGALDRSSSLSIKICKEILSYHISDESECERISSHLNSLYPSHSYPITLKEAKSLGLKVSRLDAGINSKLLMINQYYSEMAQKALTDFDEYNYHDNEILNILESDGLQVFYKNDKDWNYIKDERRWQSLNDNSGWRKVMLDSKNKIFSSMLHIR